jgi:lipopolysaccharide transport system permease protein
MSLAFPHRDLALSLIWRELTVRYKRSTLGVGWALVEPAFVIAVYVVFFGGVLEAGRGIANYALFTLFGLLPWLCLSSTLEQSSMTLLEHAPLIRKVYFPRELLVLAVVVSRLSTLALGMFLSAIIAAIAWVTPAPLALGHAWLLPLALLGLVMHVVGLSLAVSALQVILRDTAFLVRFALRLGFYSCPIVYPLTRVPEHMRAFYELNPFVGLFYAFQAVADLHVPAPSMVGVTTAVVAPFVSLIGGWFLFRGLEATVSDLL